MDSGVPQGSVLGPVLFLIYVNDMDDGLANLLWKFADDTKTAGNISEEGDHRILQSDLDKLCSWSDIWLMMYNVAKCKVMHFGKKNPRYKYTMNRQVLTSVDTEKDLGVIIAGNLMVYTQWSRRKLIECSG